MEKQLLSLENIGEMKIIINIFNIIDSIWFIK